MEKCAPVAKKEVFYVWPFGLGAWLSGVVFIDRLNSSKAHDQLNHASKLMKTDKVCLFLVSQRALGLSKNWKYLDINEWPK